MPIRALGLLSKVSSKFIHEVLPVATASVIGTMLVNHYGRQPPPSIVVQASPPPSEDAVLQSLHEEHELIADYVKRKQELEAKRSGADAPVVAPAEAATPAVVESRPIKKLRSSSAEKAAPRPAPTPAPEKKLVVQDPPPLASDALTGPPPAQPQPSEADGPAAQTVRFAGAVRDRFVDAAWFSARLPVVRRFGGFVVNVAQFPARALAPRDFEDPPTPPALMRGQDLSGQE